MIENAIRLRLLQVPDVTDTTDDRVTHGVADQSERRARIVLTLLDEVPEYTFDGPSFSTATVQVACLAKIYREAHDLAVAVRAALDCFSGTIGSVAVKHIEIESVEEIQSENIDGKAVPTFGRRVTVRAMSQEI